MTKARWRWQAGLVAGALLLAGCGTSGGQEATATTAPSSTDSPESTTTAPREADDTTTTAATEGGSTADAARYEDLVANPNCAISKFSDADASLSSADTVADAMEALRPPAAVVAEVYDEFAAGLEAGPWSPEVQEEVDAVLAQVEAQAVLFHELATTADPDTFTDVYRELIDLLSSEENPAGDLRAELGLPSNLDIDPECNIAA